MMKRTAAFVWTALLAGGAGCGGGQGLCPDHGDPKGPACLCRIDTDAQFDLISQQGAAFPAPERATKYMTPVAGDAELLPPIFQNVNRYAVHLFFLQAVFPGYFPDLDEQKYLDLILLRATRKYYAGNFYRFQHPQDGEFYGFTVYSASRSEELLEAAEVKYVYDLLGSVFTAGSLAYTFDPFDAMAKEKARTWVDPGFPIYFPD